MVAGTPIEVAEGAPGDAHVGVVDVAVHQEGNEALGMKSLPHSIGGLPQRLKLAPLQ
jgi:hypothetical protein